MVNDKYKHNYDKMVTDKYKHNVVTIIVPKAVEMI